MLRSRAPGHTVKDYIESRLAFENVSGIILTTLINAGNSIIIMGRIIFLDWNSRLYRKEKVGKHQPAVRCYLLIRYGQLRQALAALTSQTWQTVPNKEVSPSLHRFCQGILPQQQKRS